MEQLDHQTLLNIVVILFGVFGLALSFILREAGQWPRHLCIAILSTATAGAALDLTGRAAIQGRLSLALCNALSFAITLIAPIPSLLMVAYFLWYCGEDRRKSVLMRIQTVLVSALLMAQAAATLITGPVITAEYQYRAAPWGALYFLLILLITAVDLTALFRRRKKLNKAQLAAFLVCFTMPDEIMIPFLELLLISGLAKSYQAQKEEAARQRMRAAVLQMRPHFIYNTMITIYCLCAQDPQKARQVIRDFSTYLQDNFTAIAESGTVPFAKELEHTRAYLAVEQARFEGQLFVEFDTPDTFFRVPPLTLQPIVENAVKHGVSPDMEPLYVSVLTRKTGSAYEIVVEDTGPGFDPQDNGEPHIALDNIRERLRALCGGTLAIEPRETGGTKVTIRIPVFSS